MEWTGERQTVAGFCRSNEAGWGVIEQGLQLELAMEQIVGVSKKAIESHWHCSFVT